jgi:hypothetical protein
MIGTSTQRSVMVEEYVPTVPTIIHAMAPRTLQGVRPLHGSMVPRVSPAPTIIHAMVPILLQGVRPLPGSTAPHAPTVPSITHVTVLRTL